MMKFIIVLVCAGALFAIPGCGMKTLDGDSWPYKGVPSIGTNAIPIPNW